MRMMATSHIMNMNFAFVQTAAQSWRYKNEDYMTLERVFRPYFKMMQKSLQKNELFAEDEEIFDIYVDVLEKTGKTVQRSKIGTLI